MAQQVNAYFFIADNSAVLLISDDDEGQMALRFVDEIVASFEDGREMCVESALQLRDLLLSHYRGEQGLQQLSCTPTGYDDREDIGTVYITWDGDTPEFSGLFPQTGWKLLSQWVSLIRAEAAEEV